VIDLKVEVRLFATFREGREKKYFLELPADSKISAVLDILKIKEEDVSILLLNGRDGDTNRILKDADVLAVFPPVGGG
jgi:sulfur-carrier protein